MSLYSVPLVVLWAYGAVWIITMQRRKLSTPDKILPRIHRGAMNGLPELLSPSPFKAFMRADKLFWETSGGNSGLKKRLENSVCYIQLCQHLKSSEKMPIEHLINIWKIFIKLLLCTLLAFILAPLCRLFTFIPHLFARSAARFYWDLELISQNLNLEFGKINWNSHA